MYTTCMFCNKPLGENKVVEHFPVGRRLAFDSDRGRLWVVCRKCERWNLTPLEERWEAVETCERLFESTRVRASTDNVGIARHREGLELVRIGKPLRPEFAAWRYGDQFGRRRKRAMLYGAGGLAVLGGVVIGGAVTGVVSTVFLAQSGNFVNAWANGRTLLKVRTDDGRVVRLKNPDLLGTRLRPADGDEGFRLGMRKGKKTEWFEGREAERLVGLILPKMNRRGGKARTVQDAVSEIEHVGHPDAFLADVITGDQFKDKKGIPGYINKMPTPTKLALEMALHEEQERRALEGELKELEAAWAAAEEIAAIADDLLLPESTTSFLEENRPIGRLKDGAESET
ncbi:MAG: hypothetical protein ACC682_14920 [Gemmatimonadota bacterium]